MISAMLHRNFQTVILLLSLALSGSVQAQEVRPRVAVISVGDEASVVGHLQVVSEKSLGDVTGIQIVASDETASVIGDPTVGMRDSSWQGAEATKEVIDRVRTDYFEDNLVSALDHLDQLVTFYEKTSNVPVVAKINLALWRTAIHLGLGNKLQAETEATQALVLFPTLEVNRKVFPPSVVRLIKKVRDVGFRMATVLVPNLPQSATVILDERKVESRFRAPLGKHHVLVRAPGFFPVEQNIDLVADRTLTVEMALALKPNLEQEFRAIVQSGGLGKKQKERLASLAASLNADGVVLLLSGKVKKGQRRAYVWRKQAPGLFSPSFAATAQGEQALLGWLREKLAQVPEKTKQQVVKKSEDKEASPQVDRSLSVSHSGAFSRGGFLFSSFSRTLTGANGTTVETQLGGVGPFVELGLVGRRLQAELGASFTSYDVTTVELGLPGGTTAQATGGNSSSVWGLAGYRYSFASKGKVPSGFLALLVGGFWDQRKVQPFDQEVGVIELFPSQEWIGTQVLVKGGFEFGESLTWDVGFGATPLLQLREEPSGSSGSGPVRSSGLLWSSGVRVALGGRWKLCVDYRGLQRSASLKGPATSLTYPSIADAELLEKHHVGQLALHRLF